MGTIARDAYIMEVFVSGRWCLWGQGVMAHAELDENVRLAFLHAAEDVRIYKLSEALPTVRSLQGWDEERGGDWAK